LTELKANRDEAAVKEALGSYYRMCPYERGQLAWSLLLRLQGLRASLGEISDACEAVAGRYKAIIRTISGVYSSETKKDADFVKACELEKHLLRKKVVNHVS
jgi:methylmalonyl-CoA mutase